MENWTLLDWVKYYYFERKWHILPAKKGMKSPYLSWKADGYENKRYDWDFLEAEFQKHDVTNILLVNGLSGTTSIDYDPRNLLKDNPDEVEFISDLLNQIPNTLETITGSGGSHWILKSTHKHTKEHKISTCIDIKSDELLVLPPSIHETGVVYKFKNKYDTPLAPYPYEIFSKHYKHKEIADWNFEKKDWSKSFQKNPKGTRNDKTCEIMGKLLTTLPEHDWESVGWELAKDYDLQHNDPPLSLEYGEIDLRKKWDYFKGDRLSKKIFTELPDIPPVLYMSDAYDLNLPPIKWLIEDVVPKGITIAFGNPGHGKSFFAYAAVQSLVTGNDFFGHKAEKTKVLFVGKDNGYEGDIARFKSLKLPKDSNFAFYTQENNFLVDNEGESEKLFELVKEHKFELIIWDTFRDIFLGEESNSGVVNAVIQYWKRFLSLPTPCSSFATHHIKKDTANPVRDLAALARGSTALWGAATAMYLIHKKDLDLDTISVYPAKMKRRKLIKPFAFDLVGGPLQVTGFIEAGEPEAYQQNNKVDAGLKSLDKFKDEIQFQLKGVSCISKSKLKDVFMGKYNYSVSTYERRIDDAVDDNFIELFSSSGEWWVKLKTSNTGASHEMF